MIHTIREAFNELLADNHWMDDETRAVAKEKADAMNERIGYPELITNSVELVNEYITVNTFIHKIHIHRIQNTNYNSCTEISYIENETLDILNMN